MARKIIAILFCVCLTSGIGATTVSFFVIETGLAEGSGANLYSQAWENALMDAFFDAGFIVTNAPMIRLSQKPQDKKMEDFLLHDLDEARVVGADYFLVAMLDYASDVPNTPNEILLALFRVSPCAKLHERRLEGRTYRNDVEQQDDLKGIVRGLVPHIRSQ